MLKLSFLLVSSKEVDIKKKASIRRHIQVVTSQHLLSCLFKTILKTIVFGANQPWVNMFWVMCHLLIVITWESQSIS